MPTRLSVSVGGPLEIDEPEALRAELAEATGLDWQPREPSGEPVLVGVAEVVLTAVLSTATEVAVKAAIEEARKVLERWRNRRLDPPPAEITAQPVDSPVERPVDEPAVPGPVPERAPEPPGLDR